MNDYTAAVIRLSDAYESMQLARKRVAEEIKSRHRTLARKEIEAATRDLEIEFANALALETERGIPGSVVREEVLHSQDWSRWKKWRDLAGLETERAIRQNAKAERDAQKELLKRGFEWNSDYSLLTVYKLPDKELPQPFILSNFGVLGERTDIELPPKIIRGLEEKGIRIPLIRFLTHQVREAVDSGLVPADRMVSTEETIARTEADNPFYVVEKRNA